MQVLLAQWPLSDADPQFFLIPLDPYQGTDLILYQTGKTEKVRFIRGDNVAKLTIGEPAKKANVNLELFGILSAGDYCRNLLGTGVAIGILSEKRRKIMDVIKKIFCARASRFLWIFLSLAFLGVPSAQARVERVTVAVDGMSCPFCAFGVEKKLKGVEGAGSVKVNLKAGSATLSVREGASINVGQVPDAIKAAGFTPGAIKGTAAGTIKRDNSRGLVLLVSGSRQRFMLVNMKQKMQNRLETLSNPGVPVKVTGTFQKKGDNLVALRPEKVEEVPQ